MTRLVFLDTETTSLRPDRRAWDIGLIVREPGKPDTEHFWFVDAADLDLGNADLMSLKVGRFHERHPQYRQDVEPGLVDTAPEAHVMERVEAITRGAHLIGGVPNFDADVLGNRMRAHGVCPSWHYHLIDFETLAIGYLCGAGKDEYGPGKLPWDSASLSAAVGVEPPGDEDRHTALGDARWAMRVWDVITGGAP